MVWPAVKCSDMANFHGVTFRLLQKEPRPSATAIRQLAETEDRLQFTLPAAAREWYSSGSFGLLEKHSNCDRPIPIDKWQLEKHSGQTVLPFKIENQGVCQWSLVIDGTDDPPVLVDVDDRGGIVAASTFSGYVQSCIWDYTQVLDAEFLVQANVNPLSPASLKNLREHFTEWPATTGWPGDEQHRFAGDDCSILTWTTMKTQTDWFIGAATPEKLEAALRWIWACDDVGPSLYSCSGEETDELLERIREG
jgi:hypothetical protein